MIVGPTDHYWQHSSNLILFIVRSLQQTQYSSKFCHGLRLFFVPMALVSRLTILFLCYIINDLPTCVSSNIRLFADDYLLNRTVHSQQDAVILQEDLNMLQQWEAKWLMSFNPGKCEVLRVTNKRKHIIHTHYKIHGMILDIVDKTKYLGVTIQSKLNWKPHIHNITELRIVQRLRNTFSTDCAFCDKSTKIGTLVVLYI